MLAGEAAAQHVQALGVMCAAVDQPAAVVECHLLLLLQRQQCSVLHTAALAACAVTTACYDLQQAL
jgi:hypothetical protein